MEDLGFFLPSKEEALPKPRPPKLKKKRSLSTSRSNAILNFLTPSRTFAKTYDPNKVQSYFHQTYHELGLLGEGSFSKVFKVLRRSNKRQYAVKMTKEAYKNVGNRTEKLSEVEIMKQFTHHIHILRMFEAWEESCVLYMQLELSLTSLDKITIRFSEEECRVVISDIASGLKALHDKEIGHFDIKPANIHLTRRKVLKIGDFGLSRELNKAQLNRIEGDARYVAPELMDFNSNFTVQADIFSLGMSVLELAGNFALPVHGETWRALREGHLPKTSIPHISEETHGLLMSMMAPEPTDRPTAKDIVKSFSITRSQRRDEKLFAACIEMLAESSPMSRDPTPETLVPLPFGGATPINQFREMEHVEISVTVTTSPVSSCVPKSARRKLCVDAESSSGLNRSSHCHPRNLSLLLDSSGEESG